MPKPCFYCNEPIRFSEPRSWGVEFDEEGNEIGYYHLDCWFQDEKEGDVDNND